MVRFVTTPVPRDVWARVATADPEAMPSQTPDWLGTLPPHLADASRLYETAGGRLAVMPLARDRRFPPFAAVEGSYPPAYGFGGVVAEGGATAAVVADVAADLAGSGGGLLACSVWPNPLQGAHWERACPPGWRRTPRRAHVVDLRDGVDAVWTRMPGNGRRGVRHAERAGVQVETDCTGASLPAFLELLAESRERWARGRHEPAWMARLRARHDSLSTWQRTVDALAGRCRVSLAWWQGEPVAGTIVLTGPNAHYTHGAMRKETAARCYANYALHWHEIRAAAANGASAYHMGESGTSASLARFKEQFGAQAYDYADYRYERLPVSRVDRVLRAAVKRAIGFREPAPA